MPHITLQARIHHSNQLQQAENLVNSLLKGLNVKLHVDATPTGWVSISVTGEDEKVAINYLTKEIGLSPTSNKPTHQLENMKGFILGPNKNKLGLCVDIGYESETPLASISLENLQARLCDGRKIALQKILEIYGLCEGLPLTIRITDAGVDSDQIDAVLADSQLIQYQNWIRLLLDKLIIIGCTKSNVEVFLRRTGLSRDILNVESLGLFEHALTCKLGTDAAGIIPRAGRMLREATLTVFSPRRILALFDFMNKF